MTLLPGTPYRLLRRLGRGGMGEVHEAEHTGLGRRVAIKTVRREAAADLAVLDRMRLEAQALARVTHPNVVAIHDVGTASDGTFFLAMELLDGESLYDRLKREPVLPVGEALRIARAVLDGLAEAHRRGFVHRDVKPGNVFLCRGGAVKVVDFGIAKVVSDHRSIAPLAQPTAEGLPVGTPFYFSPEQALGEPIDVRSDLYSVGAMLFAMLTGRRLFDDAQDLASLIQAHVARPPPAPSALAPHAASFPPSLDAAVLRALAKAPAQRFPDAVTFGQALAAVQEELAASVDAARPTSLAPAAPLEAPPEPARPALPAWAWIALACAAGLGLAVLASRLLD